MLIDAHSHLDTLADEPVDGPVGGPVGGPSVLDRAVARARAVGVFSWVLAGTTPTRWDRTQQIAAHTGGIAVLGVHPWFAGDAPDLQTTLHDLGQRALHGIGELGLDAPSAGGDADRARQRRVLRAQLALARQRELPVVLHCVRAYPELLTLLERDGLPRAGGLIHGWSGPTDAMDRALALGLHLSFGPLICRPRAKRARTCAVRIPLDRLLIETDAPDQAPPGHERGEPAHLIEVIDTLAGLRGMDPGPLGAQATANLCRLFPGLPST